jgi:3-hydroxybutyryl-CoA dehydrogenase
LNESALKTVLVNAIKSNNNSPVLVAGSSKLIPGVCACLLQAGHEVTYFNGEAGYTPASILEITGLSNTGKATYESNLKMTDKLDNIVNFQLAIALTDESVSQKQSIVSLLERHISGTATLCINMEGIPLTVLQANTANPERIIGLNWVLPAHTTLFLEIITNELTKKETAENLLHLAKTYWNKDPYLLANDYSIRAKMISAMTREAFYLVENGYASVEDVDRACRNDAGYYLPFAGNCRYMDLMGTYAYGLVMKDLNPDLSNDQQLPDFFNKIIENGGLGMSNNKGFYNYQPGDERNWNDTFRNFSYSIKQIIEKYPFDHSGEAGEIEKKDN